MAFVVSIVEGDGDAEAFPVLLHRLWSSVGGRPGLLKTDNPIRVKAQRFLQNDTEFRRYIGLAANKAAAAENGSVIVLLDCEDDCPAKLGPSILDRARAQRPDVSFFVALAEREYETWFVAAAQSLVAPDGLIAETSAPSDPLRIRNAKGWLGDRMRGKYRETLHQPIFSRRMDFQLAMSVASFVRLHGHIQKLTML